MKGIKIEEFGQVVKEDRSGPKKYLYSRTFPLFCLSLDGLKRDTRKTEKITLGLTLLRATRFTLVIYSKTILSNRYVLYLTRLFELFVFRVSV